MTAQHSARWIENGLAILGGLLAAAYVIGVEVLPSVRYSLGKCATAMPADHGIPWGVVLVVGGLVLPKTIGRATSGRVWDALASRFGVKPPAGGPQ